MQREREGRGAGGRARGARLLLDACGLLEVVQAALTFELRRVRFVRNLPLQPLDLPLHRLPQPVRRRRRLPARLLHRPRHVLAPRRAVHLTLQLRHHAAQRPLQLRRLRRRPARHLCPRRRSLPFHPRDLPPQAISRPRSPRPPR